MKRALIVFLSIAFTLSTICYADTWVLLKNGQLADPENWFRPPWSTPCIDLSDLEDSGWWGLYYGDGVEIYIVDGDTPSCLMVNYNRSEWNDEYQVIVRNDNLLEEQNGLFSLTDLGSDNYDFRFNGDEYDYPAQATLHRVDKDWGNKTPTLDWRGCYASEWGEEYLSFVSLYNTGDYALYAQYAENGIPEPGASVTCYTPDNEKRILCKYDDDEGRTCYYVYERQDDGNLRLYYGPRYEDDLSHLEDFVDESQLYYYLWDTPIWDGFASVDDLTKMGQ